MFNYSDKQEDQILDLKLNARLEKRKAVKYEKKAKIHVETARRLIEKQKHETAKLHCVQATKYEDLSKRSLKKNMDIEIVIELCKSTMETGKTTESISKLIKETAKPFTLAFESDLDSDIDDLTLRYNSLGIKFGENEVLTLDAKPLYDGLIHEAALKNSESLPELPIIKSSRSILCDKEET